MTADVVTSGEIVDSGSGWVSTSEVNGTCFGSGTSAGSTAFCSGPDGSVTVALSVTSGPGTEGAVCLGAKIELEDVVVGAVEGTGKIDGVVSV